MIQTGLFWHSPAERSARRSGTGLERHIAFVGGRHPFENSAQVAYIVGCWERRAEIQQHGPRLLGGQVGVLLFCHRVAVLRHAAVISGNHALAVPEYFWVEAGVVASCHVCLVHLASTGSFINVELSRINWLPINAPPCLWQGSGRRLLYGLR